jgi:hypothetical protein
MVQKKFKYISILILGIIIYAIMSHDIDSSQEKEKSISKRRKLYYQGQETFTKKTRSHTGYFQEENYFEFAVRKHFSGGGNTVQIFLNPYTNKFKMLLIPNPNDSYRIHSEGDYSLNFDSLNQVNYWIFTSTLIDHPQAYYFYDSGHEGTLFLKGTKAKAPSELIAKYLSNTDHRGSRHFREKRAVDKKLSGIEDFINYTETDSFSIKWFFIEEDEKSLRELGGNVVFSRDFEWLN